MSSLLNFIPLLDVAVWSAICLLRSTETSLRDALTFSCYTLNTGLWKALQSLQATDLELP